MWRMTMGKVADVWNPLRFKTLRFRSGLLACGEIAASLMGGYSEYLACVSSLAPTRRTSPLVLPPCLNLRSETER